MTFDENIAARTLIQEARGEPPEGQRAVAHVLLNRLKEGRWGKSLSAVCLWPKQFSGWTPSDPNFDYVRKISDADPLMVKMLKVLNDAKVLQDNTGGANHYHADYVTPSWAKSMRQTAKIGRHIFYTDKAGA